MRWAEKQRIEFIGLTLQKRGFINRSDIQDRFGISTAQASIDLRNYKRLRKKWLMPAVRYNKTVKRYEIEGE